MGSVRLHQQRRVLFLDFRFEGRRRREYTALTDTPSNRRKLERLLERIESQIAAGTFDYAAAFPKPLAAAAPSDQASLPARAEPAPPPKPLHPTPSFAAAALSWLEQHRIEWRRSHYAVLKGTVEQHLVAHFGTKAIGSISKADVLDFRAKLGALEGHRGGLSNRRINGILHPLRQILAEAAERHGFASPMTNMKSLKVRKSDVDPFTLEQVQQLLAVVRPDYREYFTVRFFTGMRTGEAHGLKWKYVDFERRLILVREALVMGEDEYTKTDSSQRDIQMTQVVFEAMTRQRAATAQRSEYVFCNREGHALDNKNFVHRVWQPLLRHLGLKLRRPYQMRHTAATLWLASGESPEWIARQLGHASTEMLFRVYSRYVPNLTRRDGSAIDRLLASRFAGQADAHARPPSLLPPPNEDTPSRVPGSDRPSAANESFRLRA
jgi:integrase